MSENMNSERLDGYFRGFVASSVVIGIVVAFFVIPKFEVIM